MSLPRDLQAVLPEGVDPERLEAHVVLRTGLESSLGETHLVRSGSRLLVLSRGGTFEPSRCYDAAIGEDTPRLEAGAWQDTLHLNTREGGAYEVGVSDTDLRGLLPLLEALLIQQGDGERLAVVLERRLSIARNAEERAALQMRLGALCEQRPGQAAAAVGWYLRVLEARPYEPEPGCVEGVLRLLRQAPELEEAADVAEALLRRGQRWGALVALMAPRLARIEDAGRRAERYLELAKLLRDRLGDPAGELRALVEVVCARPEEPRRVEEIARLAEEHDLWDEAAAGLEAILSRSALGEPERDGLLERLARLHVERRKDMQAAIACLDRLIERDPARVDARQMQAPIFAAIGDWERWVEVTHWLADGESYIEARCDALARCAEVCLEQLKAPQRAIEFYLEILALQPESRPALGALEALAEGLGRATLLAEVLARHAAITLDPHERLRMTRRMAQLAQRRGAPAEAEALWRQVLAVDSHDAEALTQLLRLYEEARDWANVMEVLERQVWAADVSEARRPLLKRLASLWEHELGNDAQALGDWQRYLELTPGDLEAMGRVRELSQRVEDHAALEAVLRALAEADGLSSAERLAVLEELATTIRQRPGERQAEEVEVWRQALALAPSHRPALEALEALYRGLERWSDLAELGERRLATMRDPALRYEAALGLGALIDERLEAPRRAANAYAQALAARPEAEPPFARLRALYVELEDAEALIELVLGRAAATADAQEAAALRRAAAEAAERSGQDPEAALALRLGELEEGWRGSALAGQLGRLALSGPTRQRVLAAYAARAARLTDPADRAELRERMRELAAALEQHASATREPAQVFLDVARLHLEQREDRGAAVASLEAAERVAPGQRAVLERLTGLLRDGEQWLKLSVMGERLLGALDPVADRDAYRALASELIGVHRKRLNQAEHARRLRRQTRQALGEGGGLVRRLALLLVALVVLVAALWYFQIIELPFALPIARGPRPW